MDAAVQPKKQQLDREFYQRHADMCKVFSHPTRLEILNVLRRKEISVTDLARRLRVSLGNLSQHLNMMKQRRVLASRKSGNTVYYRIASPKMLQAFELMCRILREQLERETDLVRRFERSRTLRRSTPRRRAR